MLNSARADIEHARIAVLHLNHLQFEWVFKSSDFTVNIHTDVPTPIPTPFDNNSPAQLQEENLCATSSAFTSIILFSGLVYLCNTHL